MGQAPHYLRDTENPAAIQALLTYVGRLFHLDLDMSHITEAIQEFRTECDRAVARNRFIREQVRQLEQEYDATEGEEQQPLPSGEIDSNKLMKDLEDCLRGQREGGASS
jgi:hypothetical protein